jgi:hypothetical protein
VTEGRERHRTYRVFGEELETGLGAGLLEIRNRLDALRKEWEVATGPDHRADVLGRALDELDAALEATREVRAKMTRLERRLAARYQALLARLREVERARENHGVPASGEGDSLE